jgi:RNA polymerase sigma factor (sigma-70 family)
MSVEASERPEFTADPLASTLDFLRQIEEANPDVADRALEREIASFLGRADEEAVPTPEVSRVGSTGAVPLSDRPKGVHDWYALLATQAPDYDDERNWHAAQAVEVGLLARERLESGAARHLSRSDLADLHTLKEEGEAAWKWLITANLGLVFYWSKGVARTIDPDWAQDAFQAGCLGLIRGLERWDYTRGFKLSTFASWHVRQAIERWRANEVLMIRVPVHVHDAMKSVDESVKARAEAVAGVALTLASLEVERPDSDEAAWDGGLTEVAREWDHGRQVDWLLSQLPTRQREVLAYRYGLGGWEPRTLEQIGEIFDVTRERIRQLEVKALKTLRSLLMSPGVVPPFE